MTSLTESEIRQYQLWWKEIRELDWRALPITLTELEFYGELEACR